jgi:hypothetical protein
VRGNEWLDGVEYVLGWVQAGFQWTRRAHLLLGRTVAVTVSPHNTTTTIAMSVIIPQPGPSSRNPMLASGD